MTGFGDIIGHEQIIEHFSIPCPMLLQAVYM